MGQRDSRTCEQWTISGCRVTTLIPPAKPQSALPPPSRPLRPPRSDSRRRGDVEQGARLPGRLAVGLAGARATKAPGLHVPTASVEACANARWNRQRVLDFLVVVGSPCFLAIFFFWLSFRVGMVLDIIDNGKTSKKEDLLKHNFFANIGILDLQYALPFPRPRCSLRRRRCLSCFVFEILVVF